MRNRIPGIIFVTILISLGGCAISDHNNTLVFVTSTKLALDVSASPTGSPDFTLGYKRHEGVWMPLLANEKQADGAITSDCDTAQEGCLYQGKEDGNSKTDTYSVLASFGATFSGNASGGGAQPAGAGGAGGLAQFFATGIAAQKLAEKDGAKLVSVQSVDSELLAAAKARAERAESQEDSLRAILGEQYEAAFSSGKEKSIGLGEKKTQILAEIAPGGAFDAQKWIALVDKTTLANKEEMKAWDLATLNNRLNLDQVRTTPVLIPALFENIDK